MLDASPYLLAPLPGAAHPCPYLPGYCARQEEYYIPAYDAELLSTLLEQGFRHFGPYFFRPRCAGLAGASWCGACVPLRIVVDEFRASRSQRRVWQRRGQLAVQLSVPRNTAENFELYLRHKARFPQGADAGGDDSQENEAAFFACCHEPSTCLMETRYYLEGRLVAAGLIDVTPRALSSIYFYFDPACERLSLGTLSILFELDCARRLGIPCYYLGYTMQANRSLRYKMDFRPSQYFDGQGWHPLRDAAGAWSVEPASLRTRPAAALRQVAQTPE